jgi:hypothetical protein
VQKTSQREGDGRTKPTQPGKRWINPITTKMGRSPFDGSQSADQMGFWDLGDFTWRKKNYLSSTCIVFVSSRIRHDLVVLGLSVSTVNLEVFAVLNRLAEAPHVTKFPE